MKTVTRIEGMKFFYYMYWLGLGTLILMILNMFSKENRSLPMIIAAIVVFIILRWKMKKFQKISRILSGLNEKDFCSSLPDSLLNADPGK